MHTVAAMAHLVARAVQEAAVPAATPVVYIDVGAMAAGAAVADTVVLVAEPEDQVGQDLMALGRAEARVELLLRLLQMEHSLGVPTVRVVVHMAQERLPVVVQAAGRCCPRWIG